MYQGMIEKNTSTLNKVLDDSFILVHMTGLRQPKTEYFASIQNGELNYYSEKTEDLKITINGDKATVIGESLVEATVYGGGKNRWRLKQSLKAIKKNEKWYFTESIASTY